VERDIQQNQLALAKIGLFAVCAQTNCPRANDDSGVCGGGIVKETASVRILE
jgi:hypothetical protein